MSKHPKPVQVAFPQQEILLYGDVCRIDSNGLTMKLQEDWEQMPPPAGSLGQLTMIARGKVYIAPVSLLNGSTGNLILQFMAPVQEIQRRQSTRVHCHFSVAYRTVHENGHAGAWLNANATDLSLKGICLHVEEGADVPGRVELLFIPRRDSFSEGRSRKLIGTQFVDPKDRSPETSTPIKVIGKLAHSRVLRTHGQRIGFTFVNIPPVYQMRILEFMEHVQAGSSEAEEAA